jgi:hypothetical protein
MKTFRLALAEKASWGYALVTLFFEKLKVVKCLANEYKNKGMQLL